MATTGGTQAEAADCERWDAGGLLAQPANAVSSLAYGLAGLVVVWMAVRGRWSRWFVVPGLALAVEAGGSVAFHGEGGDLAQGLHDVPLLALLGFVAGWHIARAWGHAGDLARGRAGAIGSVLGAAAGAVGAATARTEVWSGVAVALVIVAEVVAVRRGQRAIWGPWLVALGAVAALAWWTGTTGGPLCDPGSGFQLHSVWHVLSSVVAVSWVDRAASDVDPLGAPRLWRQAIDRAVALVARVLVLAFYRSVDVVGRRRIPWSRPMLVVANHGNGFVDPVVLVAALRRLPRFMAKAALWKVVPVRPLLSLAGVLPVRRSSDGDVGGNEDVFAACHEEHARGGAVAIFPEGTTGDRAGLDRVRSGAARIALGSLPAAPDLVVVPVGLAFESRTETRGRAMVVVGEPIVPRSAGSVGGSVAGAEPDRGDVARLTEQIREGLARVSPEFTSVEEREVLRAAARARLALDAPRRPPRFGDVEVLARRIAAAPAEAREAVADAYRRYATQLQLIELRDEQLQPRPTSWRHLFAAGAVVAVLGSVVLTAVLVHLPALLLVWGLTAAVRSTATKGTVRLLVGLVAGLATWGAFGVVVSDGWGAVLAGALIAVEGAVALVAVAPLVRWVDDLWGRLRIRDRIGLLPPVLEARSALGEAVDAAIMST